MNSPMRYIGSKNRLAKDILTIAPKHHGFIDVFGGSAAMIFQKDPSISKLEVYNDIDNNLVTFFRVLREQAVELQQLCQLTPYSRAEQRFCRYGLEEHGISELERARRVYVTYRQNFGGKHNASWGFSRKINPPKTFANTSDDLLVAAERLRLVALENNDFATMITKYGIEGNLLYCDPPYLPELRNAAGDACYCTDDVVCPRCQIYRHEMGINEHVRFLELITATPAMAIVSGYASEMYEDYLHTWKAYSKTLPVNCSTVINGERKTAVEMVWVNNAAEIALREQQR